MAQDRRRWTGLAVLLVAEAMNLLDATIVQVAGPVIHGDLVGPVADIQWFSAAFTWPFAVLLIVGGRLGDAVGRRRLLRIGMAGFVLASTWCAVAGSAGELITARAVQGSAAAMLIPQTIGLIRRMFSGPELPRALGTIGPVMGLTALCGPPLGGLLTHADLFGWSWRAVFLVNVPLGTAVWFAARLLPEDRSERAPRLDPGGTALVALGVGLLVYPVIGGGCWWMLAAGVVVLALFAATQRWAARSGRPVLVEPSLFEGTGFGAALVTSALFFAVSTGVMLVVVLQVQLGLGADTGTAGLSVLPWTGSMALASWVAGSRLIPRYGAGVMFAGLGVLLLGLVAAIGCYLGMPAALPVALLIVGWGVGLFAPAFFSSALHQVRPHEVGSAAGLLNAVQQFGATLGVAVLGGVFLHALPVWTSGAGVSAALACAVAIVLVALVGVTSAIQVRGTLLDGSRRSGQRSVRAANRSVK
ncbi:MAG TPA: MFS transporter [Pseudonocardia sp.]|nr:MFS transporter [Pseudonocardia sp.]